MSDSMFPCKQYQISDYGRDEFDRIFKHGKYANEDKKKEVSEQGRQKEVSGSKA